MTVPGAEFGKVGPQRLDRIEDDEVRPPAIRERGQNVLDIGLGGEFDRSAGDAEPLRPQPHLRDGFLARDIDDAIAFCGERRRRLHQKRRLADAGIAADEDRRSAHEAAAGGTVEFGDAGSDARRVLDLARQRGERDRAALARASAGSAARCRCRRPCLPRPACSTRRRLRTCRPSAG